MKAALVGVAVAAALAGCASSHPQAAPIATSSPSLSPTPTPSPSPTTLTVAQARVVFLRLVVPPNADVKAANKIMGASSPSLSALHRIARKARGDMHRWAIGLRTTKWPADVMPVAERLADSIAGEVTGWESLATDTAGQANADWDRIANDTVKSAKFSEQMRERLGLPPAK